MLQSTGPDMLAPTRFVFVTGMSGAGRSSALKVLEDLGYEAIDNLPLFLLRRLTDEDLPESDVDAERRTAPRALAIGVDTRSRGFTADGFTELLARFRQHRGFSVALLYLDADDTVLRTRFSATRRRHPLAADRTVEDGIAIERQIMAPIRAAADQVLDTSLLSLPDFRRVITASHALEQGPGLGLNVVSFSYREGLPREADLVFDVRFLDNPFYQPALKSKTGDDPEVGAFIAADPAWPPFFASFSDLILSLVPAYGREGKTYLTIAVGCTGGRHRSVYTAERLVERLSAAGHRVSLHHRDRDRGGD